VTWIPRADDASRGVYLIWHPESWMRPHMVHGFGELRYYRRDADKSEPVPMDEQQVDRLYELRISGEQRREAFLSGTDFSLGRRGSKAPYIVACLCPRLFLDPAMDFRSPSFRGWLEANPFAPPQEMATAQWKPASFGAYAFRPWYVRGEIADQPPRVSQLHTSGAISVAQRLIRPGRQDNTVYFDEVVHLLLALYEYAGRLYLHLGRDHLTLHSRVWLDYIDLGEFIAEPRAVEPAHRPPLGGLHVLDETTSIPEILTDLRKAVSPMLDRVWQAFGCGWTVPRSALEKALAESR